MNWQDIVKVGRPDVPIEEAGPGDMEEHERRMLRNEKYGTPFPKMTDEESTNYGRVHDLSNIVTIIRSTMDDLDKDIFYGETIELPEETKNEVRNLVSRYAQSMEKQAGDEMNKWKTRSHWKGVL